MRSSKLIVLIKNFTLSELERLGQFLESPYFFEGKVDLISVKLFNYIRKYYPEYSSDNLCKEITYKILFKKEKVVKGKLEKVMTNLFKQIQEFIIFEVSGSNKDELQKLLLLAKFYRNKRLDKFFRKTIELLKDKQDKTVRKGKDFYFNQFLLEKEVSEFESLYNTRKEDLNLPSTLKSLDIYYIIAKQEYTSWLLAQDKYQIPIDQQDKLDVLEKISKILQKENYLDVPLIKIYDQVLQLLQSDNNDQSYAKLKKLIQSGKNQIPFEQLKALQALCRNFSIRQYHNGNKHYLAEAFELYKDHLEQGYLFYEGGLLPSTIKNIVDLGLKFNKPEWVHEFLKSTKNKIVGTKYTNEIFHFNLANYHFAIKDYDKAFEYLEANYEDLYYKIAARRMEIKIYYETKSVLLASKLEAFKVFIFRISKSKLPELQKLGNNNFVDMVIRMIAVKTANNTARIIKLIEKTKTKKVIAEKDWIVKKLEELI